MLDRLELQYQLIRDDDIQSLVAKHLASIEDGDMLLCLVRYTVGLKLNTHGSRIDALKESRAKTAMHADAATYRSVNEPLELIGQVAWNSQHGFVSCLRAFVVAFER